MIVERNFERVAASQSSSWERVLQLAVVGVEVARDAVVGPSRHNEGEEG